MKVKKFKLKKYWGAAIGAALLLYSHQVWAAVVSEGTQTKTAARVVKVQWKQATAPDSSYQDASTLTAVKGTTITFRAVKDRSDYKWSAGHPVWSGTSGATGVGETVNVTFNTLSNIANDYKTVVVTAANNNSAIVKVAVGQINPYTWASDRFDNRTDFRYGVGEYVDLKTNIQPAGLTFDIDWTLVSGPEGTYISRGTEFTAGHRDGIAVIKCCILSGPSKDWEKLISRPIVRPDFHLKPALGTQVRHIQGTASVGFLGRIYATPTNVSFNNVHFKELSVNPTTVSGSFDPNINPDKPNVVHPEGPPNQMFFGTSLTPQETPGYYIFHPDEIWFKLPPHPELHGTPYLEGDLVWDIPWAYCVVDDSKVPAVASMWHVTNFFQQIHHVAPNGRAIIAKGDQGPFIKNMSDPTTEYEP